MNVNEIAKEAAGWIESVTRDGKPDYYYYRAKKDAPDWVNELCRAAHMSGGTLMLPDDYRYEFISKALDEIAESADEDDARDRAFEFEPDVYNYERLAWLASHMERAGYVDEVVEEMGGDRFPGIIEVIGMGQCREFQEVFDIVLGFLLEKAGWKVLTP